MTADNAKTYRAVFLIMLVASLVILGCGIYLFFVADEPMGAVLMGSGGVIAAAAAVIGSKAERGSDRNAL